ncbi:MFS transporter [Microbacterium sp. HA-8]|uniref:MFS transporter n=1 Tax=Microbacterium sp. HA-8 TaxID=3234200 RepID=UPI0038F7CCBA
MTTRRDAAGSGILLFVAVCLIAANMRATITGLGPLLDQIESDTGLSTAALGALASVPLAAWALVSPLAHTASERFGLTRTVTWALAGLTAGTLLRSIPGTTANLWLGTALIGASLAVANVLMPAVIKRDFTDRVPAVMAVYTALLGGVGAIASGIVVPISHLPVLQGEAGWRLALLATGALLPAAIVLWALALRRVGAPPHRRPARAAPRTGIWADAVAWQVAAYMGLQAAAFYMLLTWLAPLSISEGRSEVASGFVVMLFQILTIAGSLLVPVLLRGRLERWVPAMIPALAIVGAVGLMLSPDTIALWAVLVGLSSGASLGMSLTLIASRARDPRAASALSGMAQSVGYLIAAAGPIAFGALHSATGSWSAPLLLLAAVCLAQSAVGVAVGRPRFVLER